MPPPRIEEIDFDLDSIKYDKKHQDIENQQLVVAGKNLKKISKELASHEAQNILNNVEGTFVHKSIETSEKSENSGILRQSGNQTLKVDDVSGSEKHLKTINKLSNSDVTDETLVCSKIHVDHEESQGAFINKESSIDDDVQDSEAVEEHKSENVNELTEKDVENPEITSQITATETLVRGDVVAKMEKSATVKNSESVPKPKLDFKQICDSGVELLRKRSVSSPDFERAFPLSNEALGAKTTEPKHVERLKNLEVERTKSTLKGCMSESVIKCDKVNHSKPDKSPSLRRKVESTYLTDQSDPLQSYQKSQDDSIFYSSLEMAEQMQKHGLKLKKALENVILSTSPYVYYELPYLETEPGSKCELRKYFPEEIYWSHHLW